MRSFAPIGLGWVMTPAETLRAVGCVAEWSIMSGVYGALWLYWFLLEEALLG